MVEIMPVFYCIFLNLCIYLFIYLFIFNKIGLYNFSLLVSWLCPPLTLQENSSLVRFCGVMESAICYYLRNQ